MTVDDIVTDIQTAKVMAGLKPDVKNALTVRMYDQLLKHILNGEDKLQIVKWLNKEWINSGKQKQAIITEIYKFVEEKM